MLDGGMLFFEMHFDMIYQVADIKKINGLVTDIQMFARKTLYIPLPGRHPPSPIMTNGFDQQGYCFNFLFVPCISFKHLVMA